MAIGREPEGFMPNACPKTLIYHSSIIAVGGCLFNAEIKFQHMIATKKAAFAKTAASKRILSNNDHSRK
jgi:hypothetical protein